MIYYIEAVTIPQLSHCLSLFTIECEIPVNRTPHPLSLYVHIPFCTKRCSYCAFNTYTQLERLIPSFIDALTKEIQLVGKSSGNVKLHSIYLGGGTPSLLTSGQIDHILCTIRRNFQITVNCEVTMEVNPNDVHFEYVENLRAIGVNRLSMGVQSADSEELRIFERDHSFDDVICAIEHVQKADIDNLNVDLIYATPGQTLRSWQNTLEQILAFAPEHISFYALGLEDGTAMKAWVNSGRLPRPDDDLAADMYELATEMLANAGYNQYEISNWSKPGYACRHNLQYWLNLPYVGVGPGAHGYAGGVRYETILSPHRYIKAISESSSVNFAFPRTPATSNLVQVSQADEIAETLIMGLRLTENGVGRSSFHERFGVDVLDLYPDTLMNFASRGLLTIDREKIRITRQGRLLTNLIFRELV